MAQCVLGGTFTYVHKGHRLLLFRCKKFQRIIIGLTSDAYVKRHKIYPSFPYGKRLAGLKAALKRKGLLSRTEIHMIENESGGAESMNDVKAIIVSEETLPAARRINLLRKRKGLPQLKIIPVPLVYGEDLKKISCQSIFDGKTDPEGRLLHPLAVQVGTGNPTKISGTSRALARIFGRKFMLRHHGEKSGVPDHPFNTETFEGAKNRALASWKRAKGNCDYSIGMESGLFTLQKGMHIDITVACVFDGKGETYGTGMGFVVPEKIAKRIRREKTDLTFVLAEMAGIKDIGRKHGAIGHFSAGVLHRSEQIEQSVLCAFVPRLAEARVKK